MVGCWLLVGGGCWLVGRCWLVVGCFAGFVVWWFACLLPSLCLACRFAVPYPLSRPAGIFLPAARKAVKILFRRFPKKHFAGSEKKPSGS